VKSKRLWNLGAQVIESAGRWTINQNHDHQHIGGEDEVQPGIFILESAPVQEKVEGKTYDPQSQKHNSPGDFPSEGLVQRESDQDEGDGDKIQNWKIVFSSVTSIFRNSNAE